MTSSPLISPRLWESRLTQLKSNQIKSLLLSHHHSTSALVSEILMSVLQTVQKKTTTTVYIWTDSAKKQQTIYIWTDSAKKQQTIYIWTDSAKKQQQFTYGQTVQKTTTTIYIWTVHIYRLYRRQCAKYTYIYSVHIVYYSVLYTSTHSVLYNSRYGGLQGLPGRCTYAGHL